MSKGAKQAAFGVVRLHHGTKPIAADEGETNGIITGSTVILELNYGVRSTLYLNGNANKQGQGSILVIID